MDLQDFKKDYIKSERDASRIHNMVGGKVRQTIKDIGGILPENMKTEIHIKEIKKEVKNINKSNTKKK